MKKSLFVLFSFLISLSSLAQSNVSVQEPEFIGQAVYLTSDSTAAPLQKEYGSFNSRVKGSSFIPYAGAFTGGVNMYLTVKGNASPNIVTGNANENVIRFIIRVENNEMDPETTIRVVNFEIKRKQRRVKFMESSLVGGVESNETESYLPYNAKKYGDKCYLITIDKSLLVTGNQYRILTSVVGAVGSIGQQAMLTFGYRQ